MKRRPECEKAVKHKQVVLEERGKKLVFENGGEQQVRKVMVDGCQITKGKRCDYRVIDLDARQHYVELKGSRVKDAIEQLEASIRTLTALYECMAIHAYIVSRRVPKAGLDVQNAKKRFRENLKATLAVHTTVHRVKIS